eukprot:6019917-Amphidinium_carterae.1
MPGDQTGTQRRGGICGRGSSSRSEGEGEDVQRKRWREEQPLRSFGSMPRCCHYGAWQPLGCCYSANVLRTLDHRGTL